MVKKWNWLEKRFEILIKINLKLFIIIIYQCKIIFWAYKKLKLFYKLLNNFHILIIYNIHQKFN